MPQDRFKYFRIEAREILDGLARGLLDLERQADPAVIARLLRLAHTLKGAARIVGHSELAELAHQIEDVLAPLRDAPATGRPDAAFALVERMAAHVAALQLPQPATRDVPRLVRTVDPPIPRVEPGAIDDVLAGLAEIHTLVRRLRGVDDVAALGPRIDQLERELGAVRQDAECLRLVAAGTSFTQLERAARDAARASGKQVAFASSGGEVRVDAHVLATLHGALVQLVRNAVAHGIERPAERVTAGKRPDGQVTVAVALHGSRIAVTCRDDGRGIDLEAVRRAAVARGMPADRARDLDRDQLIGLVLGGGLTTSAEVTSLAGRGIGLDIVREAAHGLGGEVTVRTGAAGTEITIAAPTSIAAVPALVLGGGDRIAAIPLAAVRRVVRGAAMVILRGPDGLSVAFDDVAVPLAPLGRLLGAAGGAPRAIVIVEGSDGLAAVGADCVLGVDEVVVRALPAAVPVDPIVWGVALDAEGVPRPVLEPTALVAAIRALPPVPELPVTRPPPILVVDDSLTTRMLEQSILESAGYDVELASSAEDGLARLARRACGLALVDVEMPGMDGFAFIAALRAQPQLAQIPAILVTSRNRPEDRQRGTAVGAQGYVVKGDFDQTDLLDLIRRLVRG
jgi:two-component system chemotaxis sensor kinase CheA